MKPILECKGLSKKYNKSAYALHNLNLTLNHGQIIGLLGPNGSGKTEGPEHRSDSTFENSFQRKSGKSSTDSCYEP